MQALNALCQVEGARIRTQLVRGKGEAKAGAGARRMEEGVLTRVTVRSSTYLPTAPTLLSVRLPPRPGYNRSQQKQDTKGVNTVASATTRLQPLKFKFVIQVVRSGRTIAPSRFDVAAHTAHMSTLRY